MNSLAEIMPTLIKNSVCVCVSVSVRIRVCLTHSLFNEQLG